MTKSVRDSALRLLARREHSTRELEAKLAQRGFSPGEIQSTLEYLLENNYLSDYRYTEMVVSRRLSQGYGPKKILFELAGNGIDRGQVAAVIRELAPDWADIAVIVLEKKFAEVPLDKKQEAKEIRFLQQRGFDYQDINQAIRKRQSAGG